ncbi:MAG: glycosyltransferase family 2 protein [Patescibacteria group bacterium]|nr:glycosyltransferase family 2 protein [Patescibacteria group bacterium]
MFLSVIIPAYNEEKRLPATLQKVRDYLDHQNITYEVIVVNDGSTDDTSKVSVRLIKDWPNFRLIDNKKNRGKGAVVKLGILEAKGDWRLFMDADGSTEISELDKFWPYVKNFKFQISNFKSISKLEFQNSSLNENLSFEIIIGSRYLDKDSIKIKQPLNRRIVSRLGNLLVRILLGIKSVDTQCGFKLFSARATEKIFPLQTITRWGFDIEILAIAIKKGYKIKEVPVDWRDAAGSQVKKSAAFKTLKELIQIKWNMLKGKYK